MGKGRRRKRKGISIHPREVPSNFSAAVAPVLTKPLITIDEEQLQPTNQPTFATKAREAMTSCRRDHTRRRWALIGPQRQQLQVLALDESSAS